MSAVGSVPRYARRARVVRILRAQGSSSAAVAGWQTRIRRRLGVSIASPGVKRADDLHAQDLRILRVLLEEEALDRRPLRAGIDRQPVAHVGDERNPQQTRPRLDREPEAERRIVFP